jgi:hypothetical protein
VSEHHEYDVFLSYSIQDRAWVLEFSDALSEGGVKRWFDPVAEMAPGKPWREEMEEALRASRTLVLILSPASLDSRWTFFELGAAVADNKKIIPVAANDVDLSKVPVPLREYDVVREPSPREAGMRVAEAICGAAQG